MHREALFAEAGDFRRAAPDAGHIHLVGAPGELRHAVHLRRLHGRNPDLQFQRCQEALQAGGSALHARPFRALQVHLAAPAVFLRDARPVEGPDVRQKPGYLFGARRQ